MSGSGYMHLSTEAMSAYVDGELGTVAHERAAKHIQACFECAHAVAIQRQAKTSLMLNFGDCDIPSTLLSKLGQIPLDADHDDEPTDSGGRFSFPVAAPLDGSRRRAGFNFGLLRGRVFKGSAAAMAAVSVVVSPTLCQQTASEARGHQMHFVDVLPAPIDQDPAGAGR